MLTGKIQNLERSEFTVVINEGFFVKGRLAPVQGVPLLGNFLLAFSCMKFIVMLIIGSPGLNPDGYIFYSIFSQGYIAMWHLDFGSEVIFSTVSKVLPPGSPGIITLPY